MSGAVEMTALETLIKGFLLFAVHFFFCRMLPRSLLSLYPAGLPCMWSTRLLWYGFSWLGSASADGPAWQTLWGKSTPLGSLPSAISARLQHHQLQQQQQLRITELTQNQLGRTSLCFLLHILYHTWGSSNISPTCDVCWIFASFSFWIFSSIYLFFSSISFIKIVCLWWFPLLPKH